MKKFLAILFVTAVMVIMLAGNAYQGIAPAYQAGALCKKTKKQALTMPALNALKRLAIELIYAQLKEASRQVLVTQVGLSAARYSAPQCDCLIRWIFQALILVALWIRAYLLHGFFSQQQYHCHSDQQGHDYLSHGLPLFVVLRRTSAESYQRQAIAPCKLSCFIPGCKIRSNIGQNGPKYALFCA